MPLRVHADLPARLDCLPAVHAAVGEAAAGLPAQTRHDLVLVIVELVTNAVRHSGAGPDDAIALEVIGHEGTLRVEVRDPGPGFEPEHTTPTERQSGGRGLFLVEQLADRWGVAHDAGGTVVWAEL